MGFAATKRRKRRLITQRLLRELITYDPRTGLAVWKPRGPEFFSREADWLAWNTKYAGKPALHSWHDAGDGGTGYYRGYIEGVRIYAHRAFYLLMTGEWPDEIDHEDGDGLNNKWANISNGSHQQNMRNRRRNCNNTTGIMGVTRVRERKYVAQVQIDGRMHYLGQFNNKFAAGEAYRKRVDAEGFHANHGRI